MIEAHQVGDGWNKKAGTFEQPGNSAPRVQWPYAIRVLILMLAYRRGYTDDRMGLNREFPTSHIIGSDLVKAIPWVEVWYNTEQERLCELVGYPKGLTYPFSFSKVRGRLTYCFAIPGRLKRTRNHNGPSDRPVNRRYGIGPEHPAHPAHPSQHDKGADVLAEDTATGDVYELGEVW